MSSRLNEYLSGIPCGTKLLLSVNLLMHAYIFLTSDNLNYYAISPYTVIGKHEYYRILSSAFVHSNFMHIFMNMSSLLQLGPNLEIQFGTFYLLFLTAGAVLLSGVIYIAISWFLFKVTDDKADYFGSSVGFSGILFFYAILESFHTTETTRSVFGLFNVPARLFPFVLLVILQVMIPGISFVGHLSGIIVGLLVLSGCLWPCSSPADLIGRFESTVIPGLGPVSRLSGYATCPHRSVLHPSLAVCHHCSCSSTGGAAAALWGYIRSGFEFMYHLLYTILHVLNITSLAGCLWVRVSATLAAAYAAVTSLLGSNSSSQYETVSTSSDQDSVSTTVMSV